MLNYPSELNDRMMRNQKRRQYAKDMLSKMSDQGEADSAGLPADPFFDTIPIVFKDVTAPVRTLSVPCSLQCLQGSVVMIKGAHGSGKSTILRLLTDSQFPRSGEVFFPAHLRCVEVSSVPQVATYLNLYENLTFGAIDPDPDRVRVISDRVGLGRAQDTSICPDGEYHVEADLMEVLKRNISVLPGQPVVHHRTSTWKCHAGIPGGDEDEDGPGLYNSMSAFQKKQVHLARAFVYNPEILALHRPVDEVDATQLDLILDLLRDFVDQRGLELDSTQMLKRRPRTVIFTSGHARSSVCTRIADVVWSLSEDKGVQIEEGGHRRANRTEAMD